MDGTVGRGQQPCSHGCISTGAVLRTGAVHASVHASVYSVSSVCMVCQQQLAGAKLASCGWCLPARGTSHRGRLGDGEGTARRKASGRRTEGREAGASQGEIVHGASHSISTARRPSIRVTAHQARQAKAIRQTGAGLGRGKQDDERAREMFVNSYLLCE